MFEKQNQFHIEVLYGFLQGPTLRTENKNQLLSFVKISKVPKKFFTAEDHDKI